MKKAWLVVAACAAAACSSGSAYDSTGGSGNGIGSGTGRTGSGAGVGAAGASSSTSGAPDAGDGGPCEPVASSPTDLLPCQSTADCKCVEQCVTDPAVGEKLCEIPCRTQSDCTDIYHPEAVCLDGYCALNACAQTFQGASPGTFGAPCNVADAGDGTCQPEYVPPPGGAGPLQLVGYCLPNGMLSQGAGSCANDELSQSLQCGPGLVCPYEFGTFGCSPICDDVGQAGCPANLPVCLALFPGVTDVGACGACQPRGASCLTNTDCCFQPCVADGGFSVLVDAGASYCSLPPPEASDGGML